MPDVDRSASRKIRLLVYLFLIIIVPERQFLTWFVIIIIRSFLLGGQTEYVPAVTGKKTVYRKEAPLPP